MTTQNKLHKLKGSKAVIVDYVVVIGTKPKDPLQKDDDETVAMIKELPETRI